MRIMEILFDDLTDEAKKEYLEFVEAEDMYDINPEIPIAIIEIEEDLCYFGNSFNCEPMGTNPGKHIEIAPILNPNFWDCECESDYIHAKTQKSCKFCGAIRDEQPDSRQAEILARTN